MRIVLVVTLATLPTVASTRALCPPDYHECEVGVTFNPLFNPAVTECCDWNEDCSCDNQCEDGATHGCSFPLGEDWQNLDIGGDDGTYFVSKGAVANYYEAKLWCKARGGEVAMPKNDADNQAAYSVCNIAAAAKEAGKCFIGLTFRTGGWQWADGSALEGWTAWATDQGVDNGYLSPYCECFECGKTTDPFLDLGTNNPSHGCSAHGCQNECYSEGCPGGECTCVRVRSVYVRSV